jgi:hypothetical protein
MHLINAVRQALALAAAMLGLVAVAMITFALAIWGALASVVP